MGASSEDQASEQDRTRKGRLRDFTVIEAAAAWSVSADEALSVIEDGRVRAARDAYGDLRVPVGEVARWQGVLGQNRDRRDTGGRDKPWESEFWHDLYVALKDPTFRRTYKCVYRAIFRDRDDKTSTSSRRQPSRSPALLPSRRLRTTRHGGWSF